MKSSPWTWTLIVLILAASYLGVYSASNLIQYYVTPEWLIKGLSYKYTQMWSTGVNSGGWSLFFLALASLTRQVERLWNAPKGISKLTLYTGAFLLGVSYLWQDGQQLLIASGLGIVNNAVQDFVQTLGSFTGTWNEPYVFLDALALVSLSMVALSSFRLWGVLGSLRVLFLSVIPLPLLVAIDDPSEFNLYVAQSLSSTPLANVLTNRNVLALALIGMGIIETVVAMRQATSEPRVESSASSNRSRSVEQDGRRKSSN